MEKLDEKELSLAAGGEASASEEMWEVFCNNCGTIVNCGNDVKAASSDAHALNQSNFACLNCGQSRNWRIRSCRRDQV